MSDTINTGWTPPISPDVKLQNQIVAAEQILAQPMYHGSAYWQSFLLAAYARLNELNAARYDEIGEARLCRKYGVKL